MRTQHVYSKAVLDLQPTLGNVDWLRVNETAIKSVFPETWTRVNRSEIMEMGRGLRRIGIRWDDVNEIPRILAFLERTGFVLRNGGMVKRNNSPIFKIH